MYGDWAGGAPAQSKNIRAGPTSSQPERQLRRLASNRRLVTIVAAAYGLTAAEENLLWGHAPCGCPEPRRSLSLKLVTAPSARCRDGLSRSPDDGSWSAPARPESPGGAVCGSG